MSLEQFANLAQSILNGGISAVTPSLVVSSAARFPTQAPFRIAVEQELMLVTNVVGNAFTVTRGIEGTTAAVHLNAVAVTQVVTAGSLETLRPEWYSASWYAATDIWLDPVAGNDANSGTVSNAPVKTMAEVVRRYGTSEPQLPTGQSLTVHQLSPQTIGVDDYYFSPRTSGAVTFVWDALTAAPTVGAAFSPTTVTPKVQSTAGAPLTLTGNLPGGMAVGQIIKNVTKSSYAMVHSVGGGSATVTQPLAAAGLTTPNAATPLTADNSWASTDSYQLYQPQLANWKNPRPQGGDGNNVFTLPAAWVMGVHIPDIAGPGGSFWSAHPIGLPMFFNLCWFDPWVQIIGTDVGGYTGCSACLLNGGGSFQQSDLYACAVGTAGVNFSRYDINCSIDFDTILDYGHVIDSGVLFIGTALIPAGVVMTIHYGGVVESSAGDSGAVLVYGPGTISVLPASAYVNGSGQTFANTLKVANLQLNGQTTGTKYLAGVWTDGVAITSANLDTNNGLQNPRIGARYTNGA